MFVKAERKREHTNENSRHYGVYKGIRTLLGKKFKEQGCNVVVSGVNEKNLAAALEELKEIGPAETNVIAVPCDVTDPKQLRNLWDQAIQVFSAVDIWVNNAGVNSPNKPICELDESEISFILDVDLKGTVLGSRVAFAGMVQQGFGQIYNVEGYGSNDSMMTGLTMYGTTKRAVTYFTRSLAKES